MLPDRVSIPGPLTYESGALPIALRGPAYSPCFRWNKFIYIPALVVVLLLCSHSHNDVPPNLSETYPWPQYVVPSTSLGHSNVVFIL